MKKPGGLEQRVEELERHFGASDDEAIAEFFSSLDDYQETRHSFYFDALSESEAVARFRDCLSPFPLKKPVEELTPAELRAVLFPRTRKFCEAEKPLVDALRDASRPMTKERALEIAGVILAWTWLPLAGFAAWLEDKGCFGGVNYLREVNGERRLDNWDLHCLQSGNQTLIDSVKRRDLEHLQRQERSPINKALH